MNLFPKSKSYPISNIACAPSEAIHSLLPFGAIQGLPTDGSPLPFQHAQSCLPPLGPSMICSPLGKDNLAFSIVGWKIPPVNAAPSEPRPQQPVEKMVLWKILGTTGFVSAGMLGTTGSTSSGILGGTGFASAVCARFNTGKASGRLFQRAGKGAGHVRSANTPGLASGCHCWLAQQGHPTEGISREKVQFRPLPPIRRAQDLTNVFLLVKIIKS